MLTAVRNPHDTPDRRVHQVATAAVLSERNPRPAISEVLLPALQPGIPPAAVTAKEAILLPDLLNPTVRLPEAILHRHLHSAAVEAEASAVAVAAEAWAPEEVAVVVQVVSTDLNNSKVTSMRNPVSRTHTG